MIKIEEKQLKWQKNGVQTQIIVSILGKIKCNFSNFFLQQSAIKIKNNTALKPSVHKTSKNCQYCRLTEGRGQRREEERRRGREGHSRERNEGYQLASQCGENKKKSLNKIEQQWKKCTSQLALKTIVAFVLACC